MEILLKIAALCLLTAVAASFLARTGGEYAQLLLLAAALTALTILASAIEEASEIGEKLLSLTLIAPELFMPLLKVMSVSLIEGVGAALCRDAGKASLAVLLEIAGAVCALLCALPLLRAVVQLLEEWL